MNIMRTFYLLACLVAAIYAAPKQGQANSNKSLEPSEWLSSAKLQSTSALEDITWQQLETMPVAKAAEWVHIMYHMVKINHFISPSFVPSASSITAYIFKPNGQNISVSLNQLAAKAKQQENFSDQEVTIFITGLPKHSNAVAKATQKLVQAYQQRYFGQHQHQQYQQQQQQQEQQQHNTNNNKNAHGNSGENKGLTSSEEDYYESGNQGQHPAGDLVVIDLGSTLSSFTPFAKLDIEKTGEMIGEYIVQLTNQAEVPQEIIHIVAQGVAAHVAGAASRQYTRLTGHQLRRITALDPSKIFSKNSNSLTGLARGDAQFIDAIHTSAHGMGTATRVGDVDFYPNGPSEAVPGVTNIIAASMRATRYFAESVVPGNEHNFPAVAARSMREYRNNDGYGKRAYMGIDTEYDVEGDYVLPVNPKAPFGKSTPARKQNTYHGVHQPVQKNAHSNSRDYE